MGITRVPGTMPDHLSRDDEALAADITELEMFEKDLHNGHLTHERWVVEGVHVKPQRGSPSVVTVWSPCCGRPRQRIQHGYAFSCVGCGWWWRYHWIGWTSRLVSLGKEKPQ
jgi:hypothetical protein